MPIKRQKVKTWRRKNHRQQTFNVFHVYLPMLQCVIVQINTNKSKTYLSRQFTHEK